MAFNSFSEFLAMGGYGFFVWLSFIVTFVSLLAVVVETKLTRKRIVKMVLLEQQRQERIKNAKQVQEVT